MQCFLVARASLRRTAVAVAGRKANGGLFCGARLAAVCQQLREEGRTLYRRLCSAVQRPKAITKTGAPNICRFCTMPLVLRDYRCGGLCFCKFFLAGGALGVWRCASISWSDSFIIALSGSYNKPMRSTSVAAW